MSALVAEPAVTPEPGTTSSRTQTVSTGPTVPGWLSGNLRNLILLGVTAVVSYLALIGVPEARSGIVVTFTGLVSFLFGERAGLKQPGKDS